MERVSQPEQLVFPFAKDYEKPLCGVGVIDASRIEVIRLVPAAQIQFNLFGSEFRQELSAAA